MGHKIWHEIEIFNKITQKWEVVMKVKSVGLANHSIDMLAKIYGLENVREVK